VLHKPDKLISYRHTFGRLRYFLPETAGSQRASSVRTAAEDRGDIGADEAKIEGKPSDGGRGLDEMRFHRIWTVTPLLLLLTRGWARRSMYLRMKDRLSRRMGLSRRTADDLILQLQKLAEAVVGLSSTGLMMPPPSHQAMTKASLAIGCNSKRASKAQISGTLGTPGGAIVMPEVNVEAMTNISPSSVNAFRRALLPCWCWIKLAGIPHRA
jgi:hypothetical protein